MEILVKILQMYVKLSIDEDDYFGQCFLIFFYLFFLLLAGFLYIGTRNYRC